MTLRGQYKGNNVEMLLPHKTRKKDIVNASEELLANVKIKEAKIFLDPIHDDEQIQIHLKL